MFCPKCGAQMSDNSAFCTSCGAKNESQPQAQAQAQPQVPQGMYQTPNPAFSPGSVVAKTKAALAKRKIPLWAPIACLAVVILIIVFAATRGGGSDESKIRSTLASFEKAYTKLDVNAMMKCIDTTDSYLVDNVKNLNNSLADLKGKSFSFKLSVKNIVVIGNLAYVEAEVSYSAKIDGKKEGDSSAAEFTLSKIGGKWLITDIK